MIYTICISRGKSSIPNKSGSLSAGKVIQIIKGDKINKFQVKSFQSNLFAFKIIDMSESDCSSICSDLANEEIIKINSYTENDIGTLEDEGTVHEAVGGTLSLSDIKNETQDDTYDNLVG